MPIIMPPSEYEERQAQLRAEAQANFEAMTRKRNARTFWVHLTCAVLAAFALVGASLLWPGIKAWLRVHFGG